MTRRPARVERSHPARMDPVHLGVRSKTMHENDRLALAFIEKGDLDSIVLEARHGAGRDLLAETYAHLASTQSRLAHKFAPTTGEATLAACAVALGDPLRSSLERGIQTRKW